jgi:putative transposase
MMSELATYPGYRFPAEIISHAIWLYHIFSLSLRDVELILAPSAGSRSRTRAFGSGA